MGRVAIGLGTNVGDRFDNLARALAALRSRIGPLIGLSHVYETAPVGYREQPEFWNAVAIFTTGLEPVQVFQHAKTIEREIGRVRTFAGGPRVIDLDVLLHDDDVIVTPELEIPHPRMHERAFVLRPLAEIAPQWVHPLLGRSIDDLASDVGEQHAVALEPESERLWEIFGNSNG